MSIENIGSNGPVRSEKPAAIPDERGGADRKKVQQVGRVPPRDRVEISDHGRALAAREELAAWLQNEAGMSVEAVAALLTRLEQGGYDSPALARKVAQRLLESGDL